MVSYDDELLDDFVAESREHLDTIEPRSSFPTEPRMNRMAHTGGAWAL